MYDKRKDVRMIHIEKDSIPGELRSAQVYIYGGGYTGKVVIDLFKMEGVKISRIVDDDEGLHGKEIKGIPVISFQTLCEDCKKEAEVSIVLTSIYGKAILKKLNELPGLKVYELYDWYSEITGNKEWVHKMSTEDGLARLRMEWDLLERNWADEESVRVLEGLWKYFRTKDLNDIVQICTDEEQYFIQEVLEAVKQPMSIIDGGAYRGELLHSLLHNQLKFDKWFCFEPDEENYSILAEQAAKNGFSDKQVCIKKGLWEKDGRLYFESGKETVSRIVQYETQDFVEVVSIDAFIGEGVCSFIKMDIEGAELPALKGAMKVIKRERPILAVCIYHSLKDYWEIPKFLMCELERYRFYVRHHALICNETILYAIPL